MSASDVIGIERLEALLRGDAPRTEAESARRELLSQLRGAALRAPEALRAAVAVIPPEPEPLAAIARRVKAAFDPKGILNPGKIFPDEERKEPA